MMNNFVFCTIVTADYLPWAETLNQSLNRFGSAKLVTLIVDQTEKPTKHLSSSIDLLNLEDLKFEDWGNELRDKYLQERDVLRWAMKPVLLKHLLTQYSKVIYCDCDIFFVNNYAFLFEELDKSIALLTPHWRTRDPSIDKVEFTVSMWGGLYNAGFIGVNNKSGELLEWWGKACFFKCEKDRVNGFYDDQKYLDLMPIHFNHVKVIRHQGCNVAAWNKDECKRVAQDSEIRINGKDELIFIHFSGQTIGDIESGRDPLLKPYLDEFNKQLSAHGWVEKKQPQVKSSKNLLLKLKSFISGKPRS